MANELDNLETEVEEASTVQDSAVTLLNGLSAELKRVKDELAASGVTNERLNMLAERLDQSSNELAAAVAANTVAADEPTA